MSNVKWVDNHVELVKVPKSLKKITGTRFGAVLGVNKWTTPFQAWCEITKAYSKPFEDTKFTLAGKAIEPLQAEYLKNAYALNIITPTDVYGKDYFNLTRGDFFKNNRIFGGMWDYLVGTDLDSIEYVIECKTTIRVEDWDGTIPIYYALQAALYAYLLGKEDVIMCCTFLKNEDYDHPEEFVPSTENTIIKLFKIYDYFPEFDSYIEQAIAFWENYVVTGISPDYDPKADAEYLQGLKTKSVKCDDSAIANVIDEYETLKTKIDAVALSIKADNDRLKKLDSAIKDYLVSQISEDENKAEYQGNKYVLQVTKKVGLKLNTEAMQEDGIYDKYLKEEVSYTFTKKEKKEQK